MQELLYLLCCLLTGPPYINMSGQGRLPAAMEESILLDDDSMLSPDTEDAPPESPLAQLDKPSPPPLTEGGDDNMDLEKIIAESKSMENIVLETSPTSESVDLESEIEPSAVSDNQGKLESPDNQMGIEEAIEGLELSDEQKMPEGDEPSAEELAEDPQTPKNESTKSTATKGISSYFIDSSESQSGADFFDTITRQDSTSKESENVIADQLEDDGYRRERTVSTSSVGASEAVPVSFEEVKGSGMKFVGSMQNVSKFFTDTGEKYDDGKSFFDSFTAGEEDYMTEASQPDSLSGPSQSVPIPNVAVPQTPPIPCPGSPLPSPAHHTGSRSRTTSMTSPMPSPAHINNQQEAPIPPQDIAILTQVMPTPQQVQSAFQGDEDAFSACLSMSDTDRRHDAWIPSEATRQALVNMVTSSPGSFFPEQDQLTMPGLLIDDPQVTFALFVVYIVRHGRVVWATYLKHITANINACYNRDSCHFGITCPKSLDIASQISSGYHQWCKHISMLW